MCARMASTHPMERLRFGSCFWMERHHSEARIICPTLPRRGGLISPCSRCARHTVDLPRLSVTLSCEARKKPNKPTMSNTSGFEISSLLLSKGNGRAPITSAMHVSGVGVERHFVAGENVLCCLPTKDDSFGLCDSRVGKRTSLGVLRRSARPNVCQNGIHTSDGTSQVWPWLLDGTASFRSEDHLPDSASARSADLALLPVRKTHCGPASAPRSSRALAVSCMRFNVPRCAHRSIVS